MGTGSCQVSPVVGDSSLARMATSSPLTIAWGGSAETLGDAVIAGSALALGDTSISVAGEHAATASAATAANPPRRATTAGLKLATVMAMPSLSLRDAREVADG